MTDDAEDIPLNTIRVDKPSVKPSSKPPRMSGVYKAINENGPSELAALLFGGLGVRRRKERPGFIQIHQQTEEYREALTNRQFKLLTFIHTLAYELFNFVGLPWFLVADGFQAVRNRGFWGLNPAVFGQLFFSLNFWVMNVLYIVFYKDVSKHFTILNLVIVDVIVFVRHMVVATKWAYISRKDLKRFATEPVDTKTDINNRQIISGWIFPNDQLTIAQLQLSSLQRCSDLRKMYFYHDNDVSAVQQILNKANSIINENEVPNLDKTGQNAFSSFLLPLQIYLDSREKGLGMWFNPIAMALGLIHGVIPLIVGFSLGKYDTSLHFATIIVLINSIILSIFYFGLNLMYLVGGVLDTYRRYYAMRSMLELFTVGYGPEDSKDKLLIEFSVPQNIISWLSTRQVLQNFGITYHKRIKLYTSYYAIVLLVILVYLYIGALSSAGLDLSALILFGYDLIVIALSVLIMIYFGGRTNDQSNLHISALLKEMMSIRIHLEEDDNLTEKQRQDLEASLSLLELTLQIIQVDDSENLVTIFGFTAGSNLAQAIIPIVASGIFIVVRFFVAGEV